MTTRDGMWGLTQVAEVLDVCYSTARNYHHAGQLPPPDAVVTGTDGRRYLRWCPATIREWAGQARDPRPASGPVYWTVTDVARYLGLEVGTVSAYRQRRQMPPPDRSYGRTPLWRPDTIRAWRPDPDAPRPGRPRKAASTPPPPPPRRAPRSTPPPPPAPPTAPPPPRPRYPWETDGPIPPGQPLPRVPGFG